MSFYPIENITSISDDEISRKLHEVRARIAKAHQMGVRFDITRQLETIAETFEAEQQRRKFEKAYEQQKAQEESDDGQI